MTGNLEWRGYEIKAGILRGKLAARADPGIRRVRAPAHWALR